MSPSGRRDPDLTTTARGLGVTGDPRLEDTLAVPATTSPIGQVPEHPSSRPASLEGPPTGPPSTRDAARIGRYAVLSQIGEGGMGVVYSAYDEVLERRVAIKLVRAPERGDERLQAGLLREAQALARLSHPNVVQVYEAGALGDELYLVMEFVRGVTLSAWLTERPRASAEILAVFVEAGRGLAGAHRAALVHRDFKPGNVLVGLDGRVCVVDFGLAALVGRPSDHPLGVAGTPAYMAPEQWLGGQVDARSDQFSFCVALWEALHGERPFVGPTLDDLRAQITGGRLPDVGRARVAPHVHRALVRGLARDPAQRHADMDALLAGLTAAPGARRRRLALALGLAGLLGAGLGAARLLERDRCAGGDARLVGAWDDPARDAARAAFLATGASYAASAWSGVARRLDARAADVVRMHRDACEAHARGEQSERLLDLRMTCLSRHVQDMRALAGLFAAADLAVVERSIDAVAALPPLLRCADAEALLAETPPPDDADAAAAVESVRAAIARAAALQPMRPHADSLAAADAAVADAEATRYRPLLAEALFLRGDLNVSASRSELAEPALVAAYTEALAARHDRVARDAAIDLVDAVRHNGRLDDAELWASIARASLARAPDPSAAARLDGLESRLLWDRTRYPEARAAIQRSVDAFDALHGPDNLATVRARQWLGTALWATQRFDEARAVLPDIRERLERIYGPDHPEVALALRHEGNLYFVTDDLPAALAAYRRGLDIILRTRGPDDELVLTFKGNIAATTARGGDSRAAVQAFREIVAEVERRRGPDHADLVVHLDNLASASIDIGELAAAREAIDRGLAIRRRVVGEDSPDFARSLILLGGWGIQAGDYDLAASANERALALRVDTEAHTILRGRAEHGLGRALWLAGRDRRRARQLLDAARVTFTSIGSAGAKDLAELDAFLAAEVAGRP